MTWVEINTQVTGHVADCAIFTGLHHFMRSISFNVQYHSATLLLAPATAKLEKLDSWHLLSNV